MDGKRIVEGIKRSGDRRSEILGEQVIGDLIPIKEKQLKTLSRKTIARLQQYYETPAIRKKRETSSERCESACNYEAITDIRKRIRVKNPDVFPVGEISSDELERMDTPARSRAFILSYRKNLIKK